jgi:hypothetical protein
MALAQTRIQPPSDEQAFERASVVLWRQILKDPNVQKNGRRGQRQNGVDLYGRRNELASAWVGIQCKCKGIGRELNESEIRSEVAKALSFRPRLTEYFITTTADDHGPLQELARTLTEELLPTHGLSVHVWGWGTLQERIAEFAEAQKAFDPSFSPFAEATLVSVETMRVEQSELRQEVRVGLEALRRQGTDSLTTLPSDETRERDAVDSALDAEIDQYRDLISERKPETALRLLTRLWERKGLSGRIRFRVNRRGNGTPARRAKGTPFDVGREAAVLGDLRRGS